MNKEFSPCGLGTIRCVIPCQTGTLIVCDYGLIYRNKKARETVLSWQSFDSLFKTFKERPNVKR